jgi:translation initiation factor IF-2
MPEEHRGRLDRAIDRAVHEMVRADPRPGLRQRVEGRIHARSSASVWHTPWRIPALAAAAVLAVVVASLFVLRTPPPSVRESERVAVADPSPQPNAPSAPAPVAAPPPVPSAPSAEAATQKPTPPQVTTRATSHPRSAEEIFGVRSGLVRATDAVAGIESPAAIDAERSPAGAFDAGPSIEPLAPITITPIRLTPIVVSPVTVNAIPGGK